MLALSLLACHRDRRAERERPFIEQQLRDPNTQDRAGTTFLTGASWVANEVAIDRISRSRCAREMTCDAARPNKQFMSGEACLQEIRQGIASGLKVSECPAGVDGAALDACVNAMGDDACDKSVDARGRVAACRPDKLCLRVEMPHR